MKLVELLAKELNEWPEGGSCDYCCQSDSDTEVFFGAPVGSVFLSGRADKTEGVTVTRAQWQAERDRQNSGEWKRHRGGWMPTGLAGEVEVKLRCGDIQRADSHALLWRHEDCDVAVNIMEYRVISQPKEEEVEVKDTTIGTISYKVEIDTSEADKAIDALTAKWEQFDGPLRWRDSIIHCQAIIEDCEREIQANVNLLDSEGLFMQLEPKKGMQAYDTNDWRNWRDGDKIRMTADDWCDLSKGEVYEIIDKGRNYITILDDVDYRRKLGIDGETMFEDGRLIDFEFVSSP